MVNTPNLTDAIRREMNAPAPHTALLEAEGLSMRLGGALVLQDVEFTLAAGEVLAVVGPNGAGKSTLLKLVCGDWRPTAGDVRLRGYAVGSYGARELALQRAVMSQSAVVTAAFTAREVVMMGRYPYGASPADAGIVQSALRRTETEHLAERFY
ncbi:MAG: ATP-binding cassette domain-containing protein, partial [Anaerolineales bacterium]